MSRRLYISGSRRFAQPPFGVSRYGKFHRRFLDKFPGAIFAWSTKDLGNRRGSVTNVGDTPATVVNPGLRPRRASDDAQRALTPAELANGSGVAWKDEDVVRYLYQFDSDLEGWTDAGSSTTIQTGGKAQVTFGGSAGGMIRYSLTFNVGERIRAIWKCRKVSGNSASIRLRNPGSTGNWSGVSGNEYFTPTDTEESYEFVFDVVDVSSGAYFTHPGTSVFEFDDIQFEVIASPAYAVTGYDQSGNHNDATQTVAASQPEAVEENGKIVALGFDGVDDYLDTTASLAGATEFTIAAICEVSAGGGFRLLEQYDTLGGNRGIAIYQNSGKIRFLVSADGVNPYYADSTISIPTGAPFLLTITFNAGQVDMRINGASAGSASLVATGVYTTNAPLIIGEAFNTFFEGEMRLLPLVWDSDKSSEIAAIEAALNQLENVY